MKILIVTDIHDNEIAAKVAADNEKPDLVFDCGDHHDIKTLFDIPHFYIHGNHVPCKVSFDAGEIIFPVKISSGQVCEFNLEDGKECVRFAGLDGHYSSREHPYSVAGRDVNLLKNIPDGGIDVFLTHESPLCVYRENRETVNLAKMVLQEIQRIRPKYVFSGHANRYMQGFYDGINFIDLEDIGKGYGLLKKLDNAFSFQHKRRIFRGRR